MDLADFFLHKSTMSYVDNTHPKHAFKQRGRDYPHLVTLSKL